MIRSQSNLQKTYTDKFHPLWFYGLKLHTVAVSPKALSYRGFNCLSHQVCTVQQAQLSLSSIWLKAGGPSNSDWSHLCLVKIFQESIEEDHYQLVCSFPFETGAAFFWGEFICNLHTCAASTEVGFLSHFVTFSPWSHK